MNNYKLSISNLYFRQLLLTILISFTVISCVTINIYFPAAAAEKAAEKIVDDVLQSGQPEVKPEKQTDNTQSSYRYDNASSRSQLLIAIVDFLIPVAEAGQANISIDSPAIRSIRNNMEKRQAKLQPFYQSGAIGFTNNGLIASVTNKGLSIKQKSTAKNLIKAENKDRMALYTEIAKANGHPEWKTDIQNTFSKTWIKKISSGWMYQSPSGQWLKK